MRVVELDERLRHLFWVGAGGAVGAIGRYAVIQTLGGVDDGYLPWGTLTANVVGSLLLGFVVALFEGEQIGRDARLFLAVGLLGGFTTFSIFSYENLELLRDDRFVPLAVNIFSQVTLGLLGAAAGYFLALRVSAR